MKRTALSFCLLLVAIPVVALFGAGMVIAGPTRNTAFGTEALPNASGDFNSAFGFDARDFMQPVYRSEVFAVLQAVPGVIALTVDSFQYSDQPGLQTEQLVAEPPILLGGALVGAQLLTLDSGLLPAVVHS